jgi:hypothetical protein
MRALALAALVALLPSSAAAEWRKAAPMQSPRSEVAAASFRGGIAVVAGFSPGRSSNRVELYLPKTDRWRSLPTLPVATNHAAAAAAGGKLYVVSGFGGRGFLRAAFVLEGRRWRKLRPMPGPRGAAAAAVLGGKLYVLGGVGPSGYAESALVLDLKTERWSKVPGPTPREHLAATAAEGRIYAVAGHTGGLDANLGIVESFDPAEGRWVAHPPVPEARSGTGLAHAGGMLVSVGGEARTRPRSSRCSASTSRPGAGRSCQTFRPRGTVWRWPQSRAACTPSAAARSPTTASRPPTSTSTSRPESTVGARARR